MSEHYDLIVIGAGPAGEKGASKAAQYGKRVALIERAPYLGGAGINTGTIPSKTLRESALYFSGLQQRGLYGIDYSLKENLTVKDFMYRERIVVSRERTMIEQAVRHENITVIHGEGSLKDRHTVFVKSEKSETEIFAEIVLIATGSSPHHPSEIPFDDKLIFDFRYHPGYEANSQNDGGRGWGRDWHRICIHLYGAGCPGEPDRAARGGSSPLWIRKSPAD